MAYLIDGNNLIGYLFPFALRDPQSRLSLISKLLVLQRIKNTKVTLVFDGPPDPAISDEEFPLEFFTVLYPSYGQNADMVIKEIVSKQKDLRNYFVVSSDREILTFSRKKGAKGLTCKEFNRILKAAVKENKKLSEMKKHTDDLSPLEIDQWSEIFKSKK